MMPKTKVGKPFTPKTITVRPDQAEFIDKTNLNLSRFVQKQLDDLMKELKGNKK